MGWPKLFTLSQSASDRAKPSQRRLWAPSRCDHDFCTLGDACFAHGLAFRAGFALLTLGARAFGTVAGGSSHPLVRSQSAIMRRMRAETLLSSATAARERASISSGSRRVPMGYVFAMRRNVAAAH
jgi:hypothetical protein